MGRLPIEKQLQKLDYYDVEEYFVKLSAPAVRAYR